MITYEKLKLCSRVISYHCFDIELIATVPFSEKLSESTYLWLRIYKLSVREKQVNVPCIPLLIKIAFLSSSVIFLFDLFYLTSRRVLVTTKNSEFLPRISSLFWKVTLFTRRNMKSRFRCMFLCSESLIKTHQSTTRLPNRQIFQNICQI